jgi:hypothetical protein
MADVLPFEPTTQILALDELQRHLLLMALHERWATVAARQQAEYTDVGLEELGRLEALIIRLEAIH